MRRRGGCDKPKPLPARLASILAPVNEFVAAQVIFGDLRIFPPSHKIIIEKRVKTVVILRVLEDIFRHRLDVQVGMVVLHPDVITQNSQFNLREIRKEFELDVLVCSMQLLEILDALFDLLSQAQRGNLRL